MRSTMCKISSLSSFYLLFYMVCRHEALADSEMTNKGISWWCSTTPHPEPCNYFLNQFIPKSHQDFLTMTVQAAMERAVDSQTLALKLGSLESSNTNIHPIVSRDCNNLIDNTIDQLNTTLRSIQTRPSSDVQTWLSAALTNIELCGSVLMANVSKLISNSLSANAPLWFNSSTAGDRGGFPGWVTSKERKLLQDSGLKSKANVIVAQDGSGGFSSIQDAINYAVSNQVGGRRVVVYVKKGEYTENIVINRTMEKVTLVGDGVRHTVITGNRSASSGYTTYSSATVGVDGSGFIALGITFRNTAGPESGQAVALRSASDLSVFYACSFEGYQDTLFAQSQRQFFKSCYIYGTVDIIFGNAAVVLQNCIIYVRKPLLGQANMVTAQGRGDPFQNTGISIHGCRIMAAPDLKLVVGSFRTYLGRPWQQYSRTVIMKSYIDDLVDPEGWSKWGDSDFALTTLYYGEYQNFGPGSSVENRVKWPGYHVITAAKEAAPFTAANLIEGRQWLPATGVPFTATF